MSSEIYILISMVISCLGLFGLVAFTVTQRTREIGIRKVLGASILSILMLLSGDFLKPILMGILASGPTAWYLSQLFLDNYAYRIDIQWTHVLVPCILLIAIVLLTSSFKATKAATADPVGSLRYE